jgi:hypothetical protein
LPGDSTILPVVITTSVTILNEGTPRAFSQSLQLQVPADVVAAVVSAELGVLAGNVGRAVAAQYPPPASTPAARPPLDLNCFCGGSQHPYGTGPSCSVTAERP